MDMNDEEGTEPETQSTVHDHAKSHQSPETIIMINGMSYSIDPESLWQSPDKSLRRMEGTCNSFFGGTDVAIKLFTGEMRTRGIHEAAMLQKLTKQQQEEVVVEVVGCAEEVLYDNEECYAIVMHKGKRTLAQMVKLASQEQVYAQSIVNMTRIVQCLYSLNAEARLVHGSVCLENVVNCGQDLPVLKLTSLDRSCPLNEPMLVQWADWDDPEYCPPELAQQLLAGEASNQPNQQKASQLATLRVNGSFDVWCFGVLWMKYLMKGAVLPEFQNLSSSEILEKIAEPDFCFEQTLESLRQSKVTRPVRELLKACTDRDPDARPSFFGILKDPVIHGYDTGLMNSMDLRQRMETLLVEMGQLILTGRRFVLEKDKFDLPCLWVVVPWLDDEKEKIQWSWSSLGRSDMELKFLCDAALDGPSGTACSHDYLTKNRLRIPQGTEFVKNTVPMLRRAALVLKIAKMVNILLNIPCLNAASSATSATLEYFERLDFARVVLSDCTKCDIQDERIAECIDELTRLAEKAGQDSSIDKKAIAVKLQEQSRAIRSQFGSGERQHLMRQLLEIVPKNKTRQGQPIVGGLEKIVDSSGHVRWVCPNHAKAMRSDGLYH